MKKKNIAARHRGCHAAADGMQKLSAESGIPDVSQKSDLCHETKKERMK